MFKPFIIKFKDINRSIILIPNLRNLSEENKNRYAIDSLINEKIKKMEIERRYEITVNKNVIKKSVPAFKSIFLLTLE